MESVASVFPALTDATATLFSGIVGGVLGGLFTLAGSWLMWLLQRRDEAERWRREDATRFHAERRIAYANFLAVATALSDSIFARGHLQDNLLRDEERLFAEVSLIAYERVQENAAASHVVLSLIASSPATYQGDHERARTFADLLASLRDSCREELGVKQSPGGRP